MRLIILQSVELARLEPARGGRRLNDDFNDRRREPAHFRHARHQFALEMRRQPFPSQITLVLPIRIERSEFLLKESCDMRITIAGRRHRFYDIAGVKWMIIPVITDQAPVFVVRGEETGGAIANGFEHETAVVIAPGTMRLEKFLLAVELE